MNPRVLELIKNPKNIQSEDLNLLKEEIHTFPYIQNIRALHLYGVHLYDKENYQKELSTTAAYTTDKKILYQLINGKIQQESEQASEDNKTSKTPEKTARIAYKEKVFPIKRETANPPEKNEEKEESSACVLPPPQDIKHIYINGERNRILFEGEENFLDEAIQETIDIESTLESGTLVTQKPVIKEEIKEEQVEENAGENFTPETIINDDEISSETKEEKVTKEENVSFLETESLVPEAEENAEEQEETEIITKSNLPISDKEETAEESGAELSFHGTEAFMPEVKIQANNGEATTQEGEVSQSGLNKHEEEMRRLIEEVEKKMKESRSSDSKMQEEEKDASGHEISFAETQSFHFWSNGQEESANGGEIKSEAEAIAENQEPIEVPKEEVAEEKEETVPEPQSAWKPMAVESNTPDSLINKPVEVTVPEPQTPVQEENSTNVEEDMNAEIIETAVESENEPETANESLLPEIEEIPELVEDQSENIEDSDGNNEGTKLKEDEAPVMNVSFFGTDISKWKAEQTEAEEEHEEKEPVKQQEESAESSVQQSADSNVPGFINTWQSWLKIDRTAEIEKEKTESKEKVIDAFIENNPRISQLKEESSYVVKEKNDDISHLMTETLANLYFEQKLYTKAIKAYEILIRKNPERKEHFESKIQEIKDFRSKN